MLVGAGASRPLLIASMFSAVVAVSLFAVFCYATSGDGMARGGNSGARAAPCSAAAAERAHAAAAATEAEMAAQRRADAAAENARREARNAAAAEASYVTAVDNCIRGQFKFTGHAPCSFRCAIAAVAKKCPKPADVPGGSLVEFLRRHPETFAVDRAGAMVGVRRLTPFRGELDHRVFGDFKCSAPGCAGKRWSSGYTYCDVWQRCQRCETEIYPFAQRPLERLENDDEERGPHDSNRCGRCLSGRRCAAAIAAARGGYR